MYSQELQSKGIPVEQSFTNNHLILTPQRSIDWFEYTADATPIYAAVYRKGKELDRWKDDEVFKNQYWNGYEKEYNGEKYYFYRTYYYKSDGFLYPTKEGLKNMTQPVLQEWANYFHHPDIDTYEDAVFTD